MYVYRLFISQIHIPIEMLKHNLKLLSLSLWKHQKIKDRENIMDYFIFTAQQVTIIKSKMNNLNKFDTFHTNLVFVNKRSRI